MAVLAAGRPVPRWGIVARLLDRRVGHREVEPGRRLLARNRHRVGRALWLAAACAVPSGEAGHA